MALVIGNQLLDAGLGYVSSNADRIYICSAEPTTYAEATTTYALGSKAFGVGAVAGAPQAATGGRKVVTNAVTGGTVSTGGTPVAWAIVDTVNSLLLATGPMSGAVAVTTADAWTLDAIGIVQTGAIFSRIYDAATLAWEAVVTVSAPRKNLVDDLIKGLKTDGVWAKLDRVWVFAAENSLSALTDLKALDVAVAMTNGSTYPTFTTDRGYKGDGTEAWIDTTYNPATQGTTFTKDSASIGVWDLATSPVASMSIIGQVVGSDYTDITPRFTDGNSYVWINQNVSTSIIVTYPGAGLLVGNRSASNATQYYRNGSSVTSGTGVSTVVPNSNLSILVRYGGGLFSSDQVAAAFIGGSLNSTEQGNLYTRLLTYLTVVGASDADSDVASWMYAVRATGGSVSLARQTLIHDLVTGLKSDGVWTKLDRLWLFAAENATSALVDIRSRVTATAVSSPAFAADDGYTTSSTAYVDTGFIPTDAGQLYALNSAHVAIWPTTTPVWAVIGNYAGGGLEIDYYTGQWHIGVGPNDNTAADTGAATATGLAVLTRTASNARAFYLNGASAYSDATASFGLINVPMAVGGVLYLGAIIHPSPGQFAAASIGSGLNATDNTNLYNRLRTYMSAVGVP